MRRAPTCGNTGFESMRRSGGIFMPKIQGKEKVKMQDEWLSRTRMLLEEDVDILKKASVAVVGIGGVGGASAEALVRAGVGKIILMDFDKVSISNINRQIFATAKTVGESKLQTASDRLLSICPELNLRLIPYFYNEDTKSYLFNEKPDFIIDAIDTVSSKLDLIEECHKREIPSISCMGTGNRLDPTAFTIGRIEDTKGCGCGLARVMRQNLRKKNLSSQMVVYSNEAPIKSTISEDGRHIPGSISYCPPVAGYYLAYYAIKTILGMS